jgi:4-amino-4-deoxy-L-arabinose transferase-like glycosyltransferase
MKPSLQRQGWGVHRWALVGLLLLAWGLRLPPLLEAPLHPDEALYGYWGLLIGRGRDPWLTSGPVYKPPLFPYLVAVFQFLLGDTTIALRFPGVMAGLLAVPLVGALARALYRDSWTALCATMAAALSPFAITFSGSAFTDPLMVTLGLGACAAAARGRTRWAGLLAGLSLVTKQTGLVWLPLVLAVVLAQNLGSLRWIREVTVFYLVPLLLALTWDAVRVALGADSFWSAGIVGYGGLRLIWSHELWPRLRAWSRVMASLFASPLVNAFLLVGLLGLVWGALARHPGTRRAFFDLLCVSFCMVYALLHWLVAFPIWSRYLLPLAPILAVLLGRIAREAASAVLPGLPVHGWFPSRGAFQRRLFAAGSPAAVLLLALLLAVPAWKASAGRSPLAEERAAYQGIDDVVSFLGQLTEGAVVYHRWLGWHYHYALLDAPVYLAYWPNPAWLAQDVRAFGRRDPRYIAFPAWESAARVEHALDDVGYALDPVLTTARSGGSRSFVVYHIVPSSG